MTTLFSDLETWPPPFGKYTHIEKRTQSADLYSYAAHKLICQPKEWRWHSLKAVEPDTTLITGAVPVGYTRTGKVKWPKASEDRTLAISRSQMDGLRRQWEADYGTCAACGGDGVVFNGSHYLHGRKYKPCECATGQAFATTHPDAPGGR